MPPVDIRGEDERAGVVIVPAELRYLQLDAQLPASPRTVALSRSWPRCVWAGTSWP